MLKISFIKRRFRLFILIENIIIFIKKREIRILINIDNEKKTIL